MTIAAKKRGTANPFAAKDEMTSRFFCREVAFAA
jgi:hypothetical protein